MSTNDKLVEQLDAELPQTQCTLCDYPACKPYAVAIAAGEANIDACHPGGVETLRALANIMDIDPAPYINKVTTQYKSPSIVEIDEAVCIGCTKCIQACPVDAIFGTAKLMHAVIPDQCTGCDLCIPPCPVDCIHIVDISPPADDEAATVKATLSRERYHAKQARISATKQATTHQAPPPEADRMAAIRAALARQKRAG